MLEWVRSHPEDAKNVTDQIKKYVFEVKRESRILEVVTEDKIRENISKINTVISLI